MFLPIAAEQPLPGSFVSVRRMGPSERGKSILPIELPATGVQLPGSIIFAAGSGYKTAEL